MFRFFKIYLKKQYTINLTFIYLNFLLRINETNTTHYFFIANSFMQVLNAYISNSEILSSFLYQNEFNSFYAMVAQFYKKILYGVIDIHLTSHGKKK